MDRTHSGGDSGESRLVVRMASYVVSRHPVCSRGSVHVTSLLWDGTWKAKAVKVLRAGGELSRPPADALCLCSVRFLRKPSLIHHGAT